MSQENEVPQEENIVRKSKSIFVGKEKDESTAAAISPRAKPVTSSEGDPFRERRASLPGRRNSCFVINSLNERDLANEDLVDVN